MMKRILFLSMIIMSLKSEVYAQEHVRPCRADHYNQKLLERIVEARKEQEEWNTRVANNSVARSRVNSTYKIPVVFHVFGTDFAGNSVDDQLIRTALSKLNDDFNGRNDDFNSIDPLFDPIKQTLDIEFALAQIDPDNNPTTGIEYYSERSGFGHDDIYDTQIAQYAWDNYRYMNVYIMLDLYADEDHFSSGVAWYPSSYMSNKNTARVVYNGRYLHGNTNKEFASTLSHEFGHWLDLRHTFNGGCTYPNDLIDDTPPVDDSGMGCRDSKNCEGDFINGENYMDYNTACYKMFTQGQVDRMLAALQHPARKPLWQPDNLMETGVIPVTALAKFEANKLFVRPAEGISLSDISRTADNSTITSWNWKFPGAIPATYEGQSPPQISYEQDGEYEISLTITNSNGNSHTRTQKVVVESYFTAAESDEWTLCSGFFYDSGLLGNYAALSDEVVTIYPGEENSNIKIDFTYFSLQGSNTQGECTHDYMEVYDGNTIDAPLIGKYCGYENVPLSVKASTESGALTIKFVSDVAGHFQGWRGIVFCEPKDNPIKEFVMKSGEYMVCEGTFFDPSKRMEYRNSLDVTTTFYPEIAGSTLTIDFEAFSMEDGDCEFDYIEVFDGENLEATKIGKYCGNEIPNTISSTNNDGALTVRFVTDDNTRGDGWVANISCIENQNLQAGFIADLNLICPGESVQYHHNSAGNPDQIEWTFQGGTPSSSTDPSPIVTYAEGGVFSVSLKVTKNSEEDTKLKEEYITVKESLDSPFDETFEGDFPPAGWGIINDDGSLTWEQRMDFGFRTNGCLVMNNADNANLGTQDDMLLPPVNLSDVADPAMSFYVAYTKFNDVSPDRLDVWGSDDCGETWVQLWTKNHHELETASIPQDDSNGWTPGSKSDWRQEVVDLSDFTGSPFVELKFKNTSGYGTRVWIDDVAVGEREAVVTDVEESFGFVVKPNYGRGPYRVNIPNNLDTSEIQVLDVLGRLVFKQPFDSPREIRLDLTSQRAGIYVVTLIQSDGKRTSQKILKN